MPPRGRSTATLAALLGLGVLLALVVAERETLLREVWILELRSAAPERALDLAKRLHGLGPRGRKAAEDWSAAHLASGAELLRLEAAELFVELSPLRAVPVLIQAFADEPQRSLASRWFPLLEKAVKADRAQAVPHLAAALGSADWHVRQSLVFLLERAGSAARTAAPRIAGLLGDTSADVRAAAASALRRVGAGPECVAPLRAALGDADWLVRLYAVEALARMGPAAAAAAPELEALAAAGDDEPARLAAGYALERIRARRAGGAGGPGEAAKAGEATGAGGAAQARESR